MSGQHDFKKDWEKTRLQLIKFSQEAAKIAKKGEEEIVKFSRQSKLRVDVTAMSLKREKLYYLIGKEYAYTKNPEVATPKLAKFVAELKRVDKKQLVLKNKLKNSKSKK